MNRMLRCLALTATVLTACGPSRGPLDGQDIGGGVGGGAAGGATGGQTGSSSGSTGAGSSSGSTGGSGGTGSTFGLSSLNGPRAFPVNYASIDGWSVVYPQGQPQYDEVSWTESDYDRRPDGCGFQGDGGSAGQHALHIDLNVLGDQTVWLQSSSQFQVGTAGSTSGYQANATWFEVSPASATYVAVSGTITLNAFEALPDGGRPLRISGTLSNLEFDTDAGLTALSGPFDIAFTCP